MDSQKATHYFALGASSEIKQHFRNLWNDYEASVATGQPYFLVPKCLGDMIGTAAVEDIATRFSIYSAQDIIIYYDPTKDAYAIGPFCVISLPNTFRVLKVIMYPDGITAIPNFQPWIPPVNPPTPRPALRSNAAASQTSVTKNRVTKPPNAFLLYRRDKYAEYCVKNSQARNMPNKDFSAIAGKMWADETDEVRAEYYRRARKLKETLSGKASQPGTSGKIYKQGSTSSQAGPSQ